jgi:hypothetical protein
LRDSKQGPKRAIYTGGFSFLWEHGLLKLSVENLVLRPEWAELFTDEEKALARRKLEEAGFQVGA